MQREVEYSSERDRLVKTKKTLDWSYHIQIENTYRYLGSIYEYKNPFTNINIRPL